MVTGIGGDFVSVPAAGTTSPSNAAASRTAAARSAVAALSAPRAKTEAEQRLDEILQGLKSSKGKAEQDAARRKLERIKARLDALRLAAGSAAATGDAKLARRVAKDIRDAARELSRALADAGGGGAAAVASAGAAAAQAEQAAASGAQEDPAATAPAAADAAPDVAQPAAAPPASGDDLASLKSEAAGVLRELKKIMRKLRETGLHPDIPAKDRAEMEKTFAEAEQELAGLDAAVAPSSGAAVDLVA